MRLNAAVHPKNLTPSTARHSIGRWDELRVSDEPYMPYACKELSGENNTRRKK